MGNAGQKGDVQDQKCIINKNAHKPKLVGVFDESW